MKTGLHQHTALRQDLRINPRLYQAMDLLYMPLLDLQQHLKQELLGNPFLELVEPEEETEVPLSEEGNEKEKEKAGDDEPNWEDILLDDGTDSSAPPRDMSEAKEFVEPVPVEAKDLSDYLREQVRMLDLTPRQQLLAEEFIGNIAEDGYLGATLEEIVRGANQLLEEHAVVSCPTGADGPAPLGVTADGSDPGSARASDDEGTVDRRLEAFLAERAQDRDLAPWCVDDAVDPRQEVELGLDAGERRLLRRRHEDRLRGERHATGGGRQRVTRLRERLGAERRVRLLDPESVQVRHLSERAARLGHHLGADPVSGKARDSVRGARRHAATSSNTS